MEFEEFEARIRSAERPLLVEFWAPWCVPCRAISPALTRMQQKYSGLVDLLKINADDSGELARRLGVLGIPTLIGYRQGEIFFRKTGAQSADAIDNLFASLVEGTPVARGPSSLDRALRLGAGWILVATGIWAGYSYGLIALGGLIMFTAVYDRCPIYRAIAPRIKNFLKNLFSSQKTSV